MSNSNSRIRGNRASCGAFNGESMKTEYEMTMEEYNELIKASQPVPAIALNCGTPSSPQENANNAWKKLGDKLGFDHMTVEPSMQGGRFFRAEKKCRGIGYFYQSI